jgi:hypothetical protein
MKHNGIISIVFVIGCATGGVAAQLVVPPVRAGTAPTRWEYHCVRAEFTADGEMTEKLDKLGAEGWELVSMAPAGTSFGTFNYTLCAKRPLP